jgi:hypothetical protein
MRLPICMLLHPVGIGSTREMNVLSTKIWLRTLIDILPKVIINAAWLPYAEVNIDRERGIHDALEMLDRCDGVVAVGGEFSHGMALEWAHARVKKLALIDLTHPPMPAILTKETFIETRAPAFRTKVIEEFRRALTTKVAA